VCSSGAISLGKHADTVLSGSRGYHLVRENHMRQVQQQVLDVLNQKGIGATVFKGSALADRLYPYPELRPRRDIDILVTPGQFDRAENLVQQAGWAAGPNQSLHRLYRKGEVSLELHRALFGAGESALYNYTPADTVRFINGEFEPHEEYVLYALKHFSENCLSPLKLCDQYLMSCRGKLDFSLVDKECKRRNGGFALRALTGAVRRYDSAMPGPGSRFWGWLALERPALWAFLKYPVQLAFARHRLGCVTQALRQSRAFQKVHHSSVRNPYAGVLRAFFGLNYRSAQFAGTKV